MTHTFITNYDLVCTYTYRFRHAATRLLNLLKQEYFSFVKSLLLLLGLCSISVNRMICEKQKSQTQRTNKMPANNDGRQQPRRRRRRQRRQQQRCRSMNIYVDSWQIFNRLYLLQLETKPPNQDGFVGYLAIR